MSDWRPTADRDALRARARLLAAVRAFFADRGVMEVETPVLSTAGNSDPALCQFATATEPPLWLRTSPEYPMKRLLAAGSGDIYELGRVFRRGEAGRRHNPEFTMLEWYRVGWDPGRLAGEVVELVNRCGEVFGRTWPSDSVTYRELFATHAGVDGIIAGRNELEAAAGQHGIQLAGAPPSGREEWLDLLMTHVVQPALPADRMTVVRDYPAGQAALARIRDGAPPVAERFEVFLGTTELANGYFELTDADELRRRFEAENRLRDDAGRAKVPLDERLLDAQLHGLPTCSGVALGVDRLLMACLGAAALEEVLAFPVDRA